ncbi:hypothetical protein HYT59_00315 [Candidatus Woesebacteria bacterium]|nr:hypothetical protein [Candidatus Woesebacteria bacterium]
MESQEQQYLKGVTEDELTRARIGVERFQDFYKSLQNKSLRQSITNSNDADYLQCVFLGIKPATNTENEDLLTAIKKSPQSSLKVAGHFIYDEARLTEIVNAYKDLFEGAKIDTLLLELDNIGNTDKKIDEEKSGVVFGDPINAVKSFVRYKTAWGKLTNLNQNKSLDFLPIEQRRILRGYFFSRDRRGEYTPEGANLFRDQHRNEIEQLIRSQFPNMDDDEVNYLISVRYSMLEGTVIWVFHQRPIIN